MQTRAIEDGDDFVINGQKIWTTTAHLADMMFGLVRTEPGESKHGGLSYLLIPMTTPGIEVRPLGTMTGRAEFNEVFFTDVRVPQANVVGERGEGWKIANTTLKHERNMLGVVGHARSGVRAARRADAERDAQRPPRHRRSGAARPAAAAPGARRRGEVSLAAHAHLRAEEGAPGPPARRRDRRRSITKLSGCELSHQIAALAIDAMGELGVLYDGSKHVRALRRSGSSSTCSRSA